MCNRRSESLVAPGLSGSAETAQVPTSNRRGNRSRACRGAPRPLSPASHPEEVVAEIDRLLNDHTDGEVAKNPQRARIPSGYGLAFTPKLVGVVRERYAL